MFKGPAGQCCWDINTPARLQEACGDGGGERAECRSDECWETGRRPWKEIRAGPSERPMETFCDHFNEAAKEFVVRPQC